MAAISSERPSRPNGVCMTVGAFNASVIEAATIGASMNPGAIALTRTPIPEPPR